MVDIKRLAESFAQGYAQGWEKDRFLLAKCPGKMGGAIASLRKYGRNGRYWDLFLKNGKQTGGRFLEKIGGNPCVFAHFPAHNKNLCTMLCTGVLARASIC